MIRGNEKFISQLYVMVDLIAIFIGFLTAWWIKFVSPIAENTNHLPLSMYFFWAIIYSLFVILLGYRFRLYTQKRRKSFVYELFKVIQIHGLGLLLTISLLYFLEVIDISRSFLSYFLVLNLMYIIGYRLVVKISLRFLRKTGFNKQFILILGAGKLGYRYYENIKRNPGFGLEIIGFLDDYKKEHENEKYRNSPILGNLSQLTHILSKHTVDEVVIALPLSAHKKFINIVTRCEKAGIRVSIIPDFYDLLTTKPHFEVVGDIPLINIREVPLDEMPNLVLKRIFDIIFSIIAIVVTLPIMLIISILIKVTSPGPIIFKQERVGMNNRVFTMYKFRSMRISSKKESDTIWSNRFDDRKTVIGTFIRKTSLDELPQFFNVLKGDMSVVGPRPERPHFVEQFKEEVPKYMIKHHVRPGITGLAQVKGLRGNTSIPQRIKYDLFYIENWTFLLDLKIILKTFINGFINKNAY